MNRIETSKQAATLYELACERMKLANEQINKANEDIKKANELIALLNKPKLTVVGE